MNRMISLEVTETEYQMLYEAVRRVKPFAEMSADMAESERALEHMLKKGTERLLTSHLKESKGR